jgi:hypothetical protein
MTNFYYEDTDGSQAEMAYMNFEKEEDFRGYFQAEGHKNNISGVPIDPNEFTLRYRGVSSQE